MRCPKCGYISFDQLELCGKCGKNISEAAAKLSGMVLNVVPPVFLKFSTADDGDDRDERTVTLGEETEIPEIGHGFGDEAGDVDFSLNQESSFLAETEPAMDLGGFELEPGGEGTLDDSLADLQKSEAQMESEEFEGLDFADGVDEALDFGLDMEKEEAPELEPEPALELEGGDFLDFGGDEALPSMEEKEPEIKGPELDFSAIDLSDLAPPPVKGRVSEEAEEPELEPAEPEVPDFEMDFGLMDEAEEELAPAAPRRIVAASENELVIEEPVTATSAPSGAGLADLQIEDSDLVSSPLKDRELKAAKPGKKKTRTGTALDNFDIDLGDLM